MQMRKLGSTVVVSSIGLGCMGMTSNDGPLADRQAMMALPGRGAGMVNDLRRTEAAAAGHLSPNARLSELLDHPAFAGFAPLVLPWDGRTYDGDTPLRRMGELLPYHSEVRSDDMLAALNHMIDEVGAGRPVFHDFYSEAQKREQPSRRFAGLFLFRGRPGAPFAVIAPGGGFSYVGSVHEGFPHALEISKRGYNALVLKYRAGQGGEAATEDLAMALSWIFRNAQTLELDTAGYSLWGSSAGARMVASVGTHGVARFGVAELPKPSIVVMAYTGHCDHARTDPPTFVVVGDRDGIAPPARMAQRVEALRRLGVPVEFHVFRAVGHGFGLGTGTSAQGWVAEAIRFWQDKGLRTRWRVPAAETPVRAASTAIIHP